MIALNIFLLILGLALLVKGADWFVDGASGVAKRCKVSPLVIGLTIVAFGTSAPELAVSVTSAIQQSTDIAIGNVVGSNIANILLILGISALVCKLPVQKSSIVLDLPALLLGSALLIGLGAWNGALEWWDGLIFIGVFAVYLFLLFRNAFKERAQLLASGVAQTDEGEPAPEGGYKLWYFNMKTRMWFLLVLVVVGLAMVVGGGTLLVDNAKAIAAELGMSERIIGLTVVAIGTSLPELVTSVVAAAKGETDIAVGNIIGSNIFNIFFVAGISSLFCPLTFTIEGNLVDACVALGAAIVLFVFSLIKGRKLGKVSGIVFLALFVGYYIYLFLI